MNHNLTNEQMVNIRRSLAEAGIFFDKLYINQAYFNSQVTVHQSDKKSNKLNPNFWQKLVCGTSGKKQSSISTQTVLTVRDDAELVSPPSNKPPQTRPTENVYDRRRHRPLHRESTHSKNPTAMRRRHASTVTRSVLQARSRALIDDTDDEFAV